MTISNKNAEQELTEEQFRQRMHRSDSAVAFVADWYRNKYQLPVQVEPLIIRPDRSLNAQYRDDGDLRFTFNVVVHFEAKHRTKEFHSVDSLGFNPIFHVEVYAFEVARIKPQQIFVLNASRTGALFLDLVKTREFWKTDTYPDPAYGHQKRTTYTCPKEHWQYVDMTNTEPVRWWEKNGAKP